MLSLLGAVLGFIGSIIPEFMKSRRQDKDQAHERAMYELQVKNQKEVRNQKLQEIVLQNQSKGDDTRQKVYQSELKYGGKFSASVRPTVTYIFVIGFFTIKMIFLAALLTQFAAHADTPWNQMNLKDIFLLIWGGEEMALLATILGFWFGNRTFADKKQ